MKNQRQSNKFTDTTEEKEDAAKQGVQPRLDWLRVISRSLKIGGHLKTGSRRSRCSPSLYILDHKLIKYFLPS